MALPAGIQPDFGRFDPKFLGVTLRVGSSRAHDLLREAGQVTRGRIESEPREQAFETIALLTTLVHETRHFHDFLLAPFGGLVARRRFTAFFNAKEALAALLTKEVRAEGNVVPVPFQAWYLMDPKAQGEEASYWGLREGDRVLPLPDAAALDAVPQRTESRPSGGDLFPTLVALALRQYLYLEDTFPSFAPYDMSEASALLAQIQEIWNAFGEDSAKLFLEVLEEYSGHPYGRPLRLLLELMKAAEVESHVNRMGEIITWTILGDVFVEKERARAYRRFGVLAKHLTANGYRQRGVAELFAEWDAATGCASTLEGVRRALERDDEFARQLRVARAQEQGTEVLEELEEMFEMVRCARRTMVESFLAAPEDYVYPEPYRQTISDYPSPPIVLEFEGGMLEVPDESHYRIVRGREGKNGRLYASVVALPYDESGPAAMDLARALRLRGEIAVTDVLFSGRAPDPIDWEICKEEFELDGFRVRQVLV